mmetsp:Transcript_172/g.1289  ORF Transcript_172/g.1289 Transcript_172/m.1289 type:complete len:238 (+) Transcript_172:1911-2624(+)
MVCLCSSRRCVPHHAWPAPGWHVRTSRCVPRRAGASARHLVRCSSHLWCCKTRPFRTRSLAGLLPLLSDAKQHPTPTSTGWPRPWRFLDPLPIRRCVAAWSRSIRSKHLPRAIAIPPHMVQIASHEAAAAIVSADAVRGLHVRRRRSIRHLLRLRRLLLRPRTCHVHVIAIEVRLVRSTTDSTVPRARAPPSDGRRRRRRCARLPNRLVLRGVRRAQRRLADEARCAPSHHALLHRT